MSERKTQKLWTMRMVYLSLVVWVIFFNLLPLETTPRVWAGPDVLMALTFAWVVRRPEYVPPLSVALVFLLTDLLFQKPPGLQAALMLIACEMLHKRSHGMREIFFPLEWLHTSVAVIGVTLGTRLVLAVLMVPQAPLALSLIQLVMTIIAYPLLALVSHAIFGVRRPRVNETNAFGVRI